MTRFVYIFLISQFLSLEYVTGDEELRARIATLERTVLQQEAMTDIQQKLIVSLQEEHRAREDRLLAKTNELMAVVKRLEASVNTLEEDKKKQTRHGPETRFVIPSATTAAFHARIDSKSITNIAQNQVICFDVIKENIGNGYDARGVFTSPVSGVYIFSTSVVSANDNVTSHAFIEVNIVKNGDVLARAHADGQGAATGIDQGSVTIVTQLNAGDEVWVALNWPANDSLTGLGYTSFMGSLLV